MDPRSTKDENGNDVPYAPRRYKEIVKECYLISHQINTSYTDLMEVTPRERGYLLEFLATEAQEQAKRLEQMKQQAQESAGRK